MPRDGNDPKFVALMEEIEQRAVPKPRAYTDQEVAKQIVEAFAHNAEYWAKTPSGGTVEERCHGLAFSLLSTLDGSSLNLPAIDLVPAPHPDDKEWHISRNENYYDPNTVVSFALHEMYHSTKRELYPDVEVRGLSMNAEKERAIVLHAAVAIANEAAYSGENKIDACHTVAKRVLGIFDGQEAGIPPMMVFPAPTPEFQNQQVEIGNGKWDHIIPLNRRTTSYGIPEDEELASDYDIVRMRSAAAARAMFGEPEPA